MKKIKSGVILLVAVVFFAVLVVHAQSDKQAQPKKVKEKAVSEIKVAPGSIPQRSPFTGSRQGYKMVTDILDGFGGESESNNYRIPVNSGGQPSAIGLSESDNYGLEAGFVHASSVNRGDVNSDGVINGSDIVFLLNYLYRGGDEPCPIEAGDVNSDGVVNGSDIVFLLNYLYRGGPSPAC